MNIIQTSKNIYKRHQGFLKFAITFFSTICACIMFTYSIIYSILLVSKETFNDSNTRENYNKSSFNIIKIINKYSFILDAVIISTPFLLGFYIMKYFPYEKGINLNIKFIVVGIIDLIHIIVEGLIIWKLVLSYTIKKKGVTWFMVMDYIFLFLHFLYLLHLLLVSSAYYSEYCLRTRTLKKYILTSFNYIYIQKFTLPNEFGSWREKKRKKYVLDNCLHFKYRNTSEERNIINKINIKRGINNLRNLVVDETYEIPNIFINWPTELMLNPEKNIFQISQRKFLFKYPVGTFLSHFNNKNEQSINILLRNHLNHIQIVTRNNYQYIFVSENDSYVPPKIDFDNSEINLEDDNDNHDTMLKLNEDKLL